VKVHIPAVVFFSLSNRKWSLIKNQSNRKLLRRFKHQKQAFLFFPRFNYKI